MSSVKTHTTILQQLLVLLIFISTAPVYSQNACNLLFQSTNSVQKNTKLTSPTEQFMQAPKELHRLNASWEITRDGIQDLARENHGLENALYYYLTAILSAEHVLIDGAGGGAKTFSLQKAYDAQLRSVNRMSKEEFDNWAKDRETFLLELLEIVQKDKSEQDPNKRVFTLQMHAGLTEAKLIGAVNAFNALKTGNYEVDYRRSLIEKDNVFAIIDEIEKAPLALQMTLLSILAERQALTGNTIVQTMLESVAATTNATLAQLINQALPYEVGGRMALIDRFALKVHIVNTSPTLNDAFMLVETVQRSRNENKYTVIDLRGLRPLLQQVKISRELLEAARDIEINMTEQYVQAYDFAKEEAFRTRSTPKYYPPYSGSTRSAGKIERIWPAAFLIRQLMMGVPFESVRLEMKPQDLIDLAPIFLHGGTDSIIPKFGAQINFYQRAILNNGGNTFSSDILISNKFKPGNTRIISSGFYDPHTQIFQYQSANTGLFHRILFDVQKGELLINSPDVQAELITSANQLRNSTHLDKQVLLELNKNLAKRHEQAQTQTGIWARIGSLFPVFERTRKSEEIQQSFARNETKLQDQLITQKLDEFIKIVNVKIAQLSEIQHTPLNGSKYNRTRAAFNRLHEKTAREYYQALTNNDFNAAVIAAVKLVRNAYKEYNFFFKESEQDSKAILLAMMNKANLLLSGPPGSAKTLKARIALNMALKAMSEEQIIALNSELAKALIADRVHVTDKSIYIKQFHPMSSEGEIVGRVSLKALEKGLGYRNTRKGTMSARSVTFALLDEFEKAPAQVRTALLSILNEREIFDGDKIVKLAIENIIISTNNTASELLVSLGDFSTAFPVYDRIHYKAYVSNKLSPNALLEYLVKNQLGIRGDFNGMLAFEPLRRFAERFEINKDENYLLIEIYNNFMKTVVARSEQERTAYEGDTQIYPQFFMNTRGESNRSLNSVINEFKGAVTLNRALSGELATLVTKGESFKFDIKDLLTFGELFLTFNNQFKLDYEITSTGMLRFVVKEGNFKEIESRLDTRDKTEIEYKRWEIEQMAHVLNTTLDAFISSKNDLILKFPNLYPSLFSDKSARIQHLLRSGIDKEEIEKIYGKIN